ncbi:MAG: hypothetical protein QN178_08595 [Armatimonadota bacterium]|nr:hypothetical protein [Armatimonadota bacterium]
MSRYLLAAILALGVHFSASYLVPLDDKSQGAFLGLLKWVWPWADGDGGVLGRITLQSGFPISGFFIAMTSAGLFFLAAMAVMGWWIPLGWWRALAGAGAAIQLILMVLFIAPNKLLPIIFNLLLLYLLWTGNPALSIR